MVGDKFHIYEDIKAKILSTELLPGDKVSENKLSEIYDVSRTPIRQVLQLLSNEGLIEIVPQKGTYVTKISISLVKDVIFLRKCIEPAIFATLIKQDLTKLINELNDNIQEQEQLGENDYVKFNYLDNLFHYTLHSYANKENIYKIIEGNAHHYNRLRVIYEKIYDISSKIDEHKQIVKALENKDIDAFNTILEEHIKPLSDEIEVGHFDAISEYIKE